MSKIIRDPEKAQKETYDLIIIGGGIYGVMLSFEASRRGLKSVLLERDDFGQHTSFNSLRIIHGGLRYLQTLDLHRFRESVRERKWFLKNFPSLVKPLPCLMPLYGNGLHRPFVLQLALWINGLLSYHRNKGLEKDHHLPVGRIVDVHETQKLFHLVDSQGLKGSAIWYDALMTDSQRLLINLLHLASELGATAINYMEVVRLLKEKERVTGVCAIDKNNGDSIEYKSNVVVNACGPWSRDIAKCFDRDEPNLFRASLAWNVLLAKEPLSDHALAVESKKPNARTYFLVPWKDHILAGTGHAPWVQGASKSVKPSVDQLADFLDDLNSAVPGINLNLDSVIRILPGLLPVVENGEVDLSDREVIFNHASNKGPVGLWSVSGVKFTTSRLVAEKAIKSIFPSSHAAQLPMKDGFYSSILNENMWNIDIEGLTDPHKSSVRELLRSLINNESVIHLDDLVLRRTSLWLSPKKCMDNINLFATLFDWDESHVEMEKERLKTKF
jgi:glycerol-3-phosphate dehydrogenase